MDRTLLLMACSPLDSLSDGLAYRRARATLIMLANGRNGESGFCLHLTGAEIDGLVMYGDMDPRIWFIQSYPQEVTSPHRILLH
jgi:hypothetical protein